MKKITLLIMLLISTNVLLAQPTPVAPSVGDGSVGAPWEIATLANLYWIAVDTDNWNDHYIQTADIDASASSGWSGGGWVIIGNSSTNFTGSYDGQGHTISGIYIHRAVSNVGLFGYVNGATIQNLGVPNVDISAWDHTGGLAGQVKSTIINNCFSSGTVYGQGNGNDYAYTGGLIGTIEISTSVSNCYSTADVSGPIRQWGGFTSYVSNSTITNCYSAGIVSGGVSGIGGFIGSGTNSTVTDCFWDTDVSTRSTSWAGTGKTTVEMKTLATFTDEATVGLTTAWDFVTNPNDDAANDDLWDMDLSETINSGYPFLSWENGAETALPITLSSFTASAVNGAVKLSWETATETNNARFVIYRNNVAIVSIDGAGTTTEPHAYSFVDNNVVPGVTYTYVLADVNYANEETKYETDAVTVTVGNDLVEADFVVGNAYPNPFNPRTVISLQYAVGSNSVVNIYNTQGKLVDQLVNGFVEAKNYELTWDASDMPSGIYIIKATAGKITRSQKIALMK